MSKKPAAALSASLVAVKGTAAPVPDMSGRTEAPVILPAPNAEETKVLARSAPKREEGGALSPLNFRVPASFRRDFKTYAARHDLKLNELLRLSFEAFRKVRGD